MTTTVTTGEGSADAFVESAEDQFRDALGFRPFHGTLNLEGTNDVPELTEWMPWEANDHCDGVAYEPCYVSGVRAAVIRPEVPNYPAEKSELLAPVQLRTLFDIKDGDKLSLTECPWTSEGLTTSPDRLDAFDAVVFDFDGTLAELAVDWAIVHEEIADLLDPYLEKSLTKYKRAEIFRIARDADVYTDIESLLTTAEVDAVADSSVRDELLHVESLDCPVGICTANASEAVRSILERHGVAELFEVIVARDTIPESKPNPFPLIHCAKELGADLGNSLFVGDERTDAEAAQQSGTSFLQPAQLRTDI